MSIARAIHRSPALQRIKRLNRERDRNPGNVGCVRGTIFRCHENPRAAASSHEEISIADVPAIRPHILQCLDVFFNGKRITEYAD